MNPSPKAHLSVFLSFSGSGGVERMMYNLLPEFLQAGYTIDLLVIQRKPLPELLQMAGPHLRVIDLGVNHTLLAIPALIHYFRTEHPSVLLVAKDRAIRTAIIARFLSGRPVRLIGKLETHLSASLARKAAWLRWLRIAPMRYLYPALDGLIANAQGVADDAAQLTGLPRGKIHVIRNPVITADIDLKSAASVEHPWFADTSVPLLVAAGRLTPQKDFATLIQAFALLQAERPSRLVILGEGRLRTELEAQIANLGLGARVWLAGHVDNPFAYMAKASLFVLSSRWEGLPNVLAEAMALGVPVVSTDCPSGPSEIMAGGRLGPLVPVGDAAQLAVAMREGLDHPPAAGLLKQAAAEYHAEPSAAHHLRVLGLA